jgi:pilus assembly protein CpaB
LIAVMLALVCGGSAAVGVSSYMNNYAPGATGDVARVVVAAIDIPRGSVVTTDQVRIREIPKGQVHPRAITKIDDAVNRAVLTPLIKDEPLLEGKLAPKGSKGSMSWVTKPGMRAFTIQIPSISSGMAGFAMPGDHVDVLLTMTGDDRDGTGGGSTMTLLENIEVMAVDQTIEAPAANKVDANHLRSVTLQVTPEQSLQLDLGQSRGTLHLSLRHPEDSKDSRTKTATLNELKYRNEPRKVVEATEISPPPPPVVEAPKGPPPPKPIYVYRSMTQRLEEHQNDGTALRRVLTEGSSQMAFPNQDPNGPTTVQFR